MSRPEEVVASASNAETLKRRVEAYCKSIGREINITLIGTKHQRYVVTEKGRSRVPLASFAAHSSDNAMYRHAESDLTNAGLLPPKKKEDRMARTTAVEVAASEELRQRMVAVVEELGGGDDARETIVAKALELAEQGVVESFEASGRPPESVVRIYIQRLLDEGGGMKQKNLDRFGTILDAFQESGTNGNGHVTLEPEPESVADEAERIVADVLGEEQAEETQVEEAPEKTQEHEELLQVAEAALHDAEAARNEAVAENDRLAEENRRLTAQYDDISAAHDELVKQVEALRAELDEAGMAREAQAARIAELTAEIESQPEPDTSAERPRPDLGALAERLRLLGAAGASVRPVSAPSSLEEAVRGEWGKALLRLFDRLDADSIPEWLIDALRELSGMERAAE